MALLRQGEAWIQTKNGWFRYRNPCAIIEAWTLAEVSGALELVAQMTDGGLHAVGFVAYEAAPAFDSHLQVCVTAGRMPLVWFSFYADRDLLPFFPVASASSEVKYFARQSRHCYTNVFGQIARHIQQGNCYQVNYTFPLVASSADAQSHEQALWQLASSAQGYGALLVGNGWRIASASPELFFARKGCRIRCRPMKGTRARGRDANSDLQLRTDLASHSKDRAENLMIVDMIRNDLGKIAQCGSVHVHDLLAIECYTTVWQMVSGVEAASTASLPRIFAALFPCASVTGAPKDAAMAIITHTENAPRGVYTGTIGYVEPGGNAVFNVAIRTLVEDATGLHYQVGSGLVADSVANEEYDECLQKARVLGDVMEPIRLYETMLTTPENEIWFVREHQERLRKSAGLWGYPFPEQEIAERLAHIPGEGFRRVRLLLDSDGVVELEAIPLSADPRIITEPWKVCLDDRPLGADPQLCRNKTTARAHYEKAMARFPQCMDVLLYDQDGYLTVSCRANIVVEDDLGKWTPPLEQPLLPGVFRRHLLEQGVIRERPIHRNEISQMRRIWLTNSLRGWIPVEIQPQ